MIQVGETVREERDLKIMLITPYPAPLVSAKPSGYSVILKVSMNEVLNVPLRKSSLRISCW
jgi:hypothetical protein